MLKPDIAKDEKDRIEALKLLNVLDTISEERFDRLTRMAQRMFGVPIALVSLVDSHRQWFKSNAGLDAKETSREISFCGHTILGKDVFVIPDTLKDDRFADNPLVTEDPKIRFYAGCPLNTPNGSKVGTLCLIDKKVRHFTAEDELALVDLAQTVESELTAVQMATMDELTDLSNRRGFLMRSKQSLDYSMRYKLSGSLVFLDLDDFKSINDDFGHEEGDKALVGFAECLKNACRDSDIIARFGGDEFIIFLSGITKQQTDVFIKKLANSLANHNQQANRGYDISFSYGVARFNSKKQNSIKELLSEADMLMYKNKQTMIKSKTLLNV